MKMRFTQRPITYAVFITLFYMLRLRLSEKANLASVKPLTAITATLCQSEREREHLIS